VTGKSHEPSVSNELTLLSTGEVPKAISSPTRRGASGTIKQSYAAVGFSAPFMKLSIACVN
jgi:hypothetical protein